MLLFSIFDTRILSSVYLAFDKVSNSGSFSYNTFDKPQKWCVNLFYLLCSSCRHWTERLKWNNSTKGERGNVASKKWHQKLAFSVIVFDVTLYNLRLAVLHIPVPGKMKKYAPEQNNGPTGSSYIMGVHGKCAHRLRAYIDVVFLVAQKEVVHDGSFVKLCQCRHVLHSMDAAGVHRVHRLPVQLRLLYVDHLEKRTQTYPKNLAFTVLHPCCQYIRAATNFLK